MSAIDIHDRNACLYEAGCTGCLTPGESTIGDAAALYGVPVPRVLRVLADALTDVYTPDGDDDTDGIGGVIAQVGWTWAVVSTRLGEVRRPAASLILASDSVAVLLAEHRGERGKPRKL